MLGGVLSPADRGDPPKSDAPPPGRPAVLVADEELHPLLAGLLRLERHRIVREAASLGDLSREPLDPPSATLVFAPAAGSRDWPSMLSEVLRARPEWAAVVLLGAADEPMRAAAVAAGARLVLVRPVSLKEFGEALASMTAPAFAAGVGVVLPRASSP
jgi:DNA-binding NarL/FixJ family response regulator